MTEMQTDSVTLAVARTVAERTGRDAADLPPLYWRVDTDALEALFAPTRRTDRTGVVEFRYDGFLVRVTVEDDLTVSLEGCSSGQSSDRGR